MRVVPLIAILAACGAGEPGPAQGPVAVRGPDDARLAPIDAPPDAPPARADDFVEVAAAIPDAVIDLRYAGDRNLTGAPLYPRDARCLLRRAVATRLARAADALRAADRRLVFWDCYRPHSVQLALWQALPAAAFVARPASNADGTPRSGSDHTRGAAVDVSLADRAGTIVAMPTDHDDATPAAARVAARKRSADARRLDDAMTGAGFRPLASEWWHFAAPDAGRYPLRDGWPAIAR